jgi:hypothetical protein
LSVAVVEVFSDTDVDPVEFAVNEGIEPGATTLIGPVTGFGIWMVGMVNVAVVPDGVAPVEVTVMVALPPMVPPAIREARLCGN